MAVIKINVDGECFIINHPTKVCPYYRDSFCYKYEKEFKSYKRLPICKKENP
jgi:hypothetical protein